MTELAATVGERIAQLRASAGQTQPEFARQLGITARTLKAYEAGESPANLATVAALCAQGVSADWLITGEGPMRRDEVPVRNLPEPGPDVPPPRPPSIGSIDPQLLEITFEELENMLELAGVTDVPRPARAQLVSSVYALAEASLVAEASIGRDKEAAREAVIRHMQLLRAAIQALGGKIGGGELT